MMTFWKVKCLRTILWLELHRAPLMHISEVLPVVWAPHPWCTCLSTPLWSHEFVTEVHRSSQYSLQCPGSYCFGIDWSVGHSLGTVHSIYRHHLVSEWTYFCCFLLLLIDRRLSCAIFYRVVNVEDCLLI